MRLTYPHVKLITSHHATHDVKKLHVALGRHYIFFTFYWADSGINMGNLFSLLQLTQEDVNYSLDLWTSPRWTYKLKIVDMQIAIIAWNNHQLFLSTRGWSAIFSINWGALNRESDLKFNLEISISKTSRDVESFWRLVFCIKLMNS